MKELVITKARPAVQSQVVEDVHIEIRETAMTEVKVDSLSLADLGRFYEEDARILFDALQRALPGGTFDRLLCLMLTNKASSLIIPHDFFEKVETINANVI